MSITPRVLLAAVTMLCLFASPARAFDADAAGTAEVPCSSLCRYWMSLGSSGESSSPASERDSGRDTQPVIPKPPAAGVAAEAAGAGAGTAKVSGRQAIDAGKAAADPRRMRVAAKPATKTAVPRPEERRVPVAAVAARSVPTKPAMAAAPIPRPERSAALAVEPAPRTSPPPGPAATALSAPPSAPASAPTAVARDVPPPVVIPAQAPEAAPMLGPAPLLAPARPVAAPASDSDGRTSRPIARDPPPAAAAATPLGVKLGFYVALAILALLACRRRAPSPVLA